MSNFRVGGKAFCTNKLGWICGVSGRNGLPGPRYADILNITWIGLEDGVTCLRFSEWTGPEDSFAHWAFRPLDNLEEQIEAIEEEGAPVELEPEHA